MNASDFPQQLSLRCGPVAAIDLALYAAASGDHNLLHLDAKVARAAGFDRPVVHGMLTMAYAAPLFTNAFGAGSVRVLETRFSAVAMLGDTVLLSSTLAQVEGALGHYELRACNAAGVELMTGRAKVAPAAAP